MPVRRASDGLLMPEIRALKGCRTCDGTFPLCQHEIVRERVRRVLGHRSDREVSPTSTLESVFVTATETKARRFDRWLMIRRSLVSYMGRGPLGTTA